MHLRHLAAIGALLATELSAQTLVIPNGTAATEGASSTAYSWGRGNAQIRCQYVYDASHFTAQGVNFPIVINQLRFRANGGATTAGYTYGNAVVQMSTAAVDYLTPSATFAANHGPDLATVYSGAVVVASGAGTTPNNWFVTLPITPFLYDPSSGSDFCLDLAHDGVGPSGSTGPAHDCGTTGSLTSRIYNLTTWTSPTGTTQQNVGIVVELGYTPASGLYAGFSASATTGALPLTVNFTDTSFSSDPNGITSWAWDLDGDNIIDSTAQNPSFTYTTCGDYTVSLTVTDGTHAPSTLTRSAYIRAGDATTPSFTVSQIAPNTFQFTDTTSPAATSWAWDLDGDGLTDSTAQNPVWTYPQSCVGVNVRLTVMRDCRGPFTVTNPIALVPNSLTAATAGGNGLSSTTYMGNMFDIQVLNPQGINICALSMRPYTFTGPYNLSVYVTPGTYVGNQFNASAWRLVGTGAGVSAGGTTATSVLTVTPLNDFAYLPPGNYGMAVYIHYPSTTVYLAYTNGPVGPFANSDLVITPSPATAPGRSMSLLFASSGVDSRMWNGAIHYSTASNGGDAGFGFFAPGCAGSMGITNLSGNRPQLGAQLNVNLNNLPQSLAIMMTGFSRTTSLFGALPLSLASFGAPGCFGRVSPDATLFLLGAANAATWSFQVPNNGALAGLQMYSQALVFDAGFNALGAVASDAAGMLIGL